METSFKLPDKWAVKITEENKIILKEWRTIPKLNAQRGYLLSPDHPFGRVGTRGYWVPNLPGDTVIISFEQFKKYVLEEDCTKKRKYYIKEIEANPRLLIYLDSKKEHNKLAKITRRLYPYYGQYCYNLNRNSFSEDSSKTNIGGYANSFPDSVILTINDIIELNEEHKLLPSDYTPGENINSKTTSNENSNIQRAIIQDGFSIRSRRFRFEDTRKEIFNRSGFSKSKGKPCFQEARIN